MKTYIKARREVVEQVGISQYLFNFDFDIPQVGLECRAELTFEPKKFINNLYEHLLASCEQRLKQESMLYVKQDGTQAQITPSMLASLCMNLTTQAMQDVTDSGKSLMTVIVKERKEVLKEYREKTKDEIAKLEEQVRNNERKAASLKSIANEEKNVPEMAGISSEKISTSVSTTQVEQYTTQEKKQPNESVKNKNPKKTNLHGLL